MITCKTKQWGNSIGLILPRDIVRDMNIKPDEEVVLNIEKKGTVLRELFDRLEFKKSTRTLLDESRKAMQSKFD